MKRMGPAFLSLHTLGMKGHRVGNGARLRAGLISQATNGMDEVKGAARLFALWALVPCAGLLFISSSHRDEDKRVGRRGRGTGDTGNGNTGLQTPVLRSTTGDREPLVPEGYMGRQPTSAGNRSTMEVPRKYQGRREVGGNKIQSGRGSSPTEAQFLANQRREAVESERRVTVPVSGGICS
jgi:hypothetical protein